jgi:hypothetical protein
VDDKTDCVSILVDFYDDEEKKRLLGYQRAAEIVALAGTVVTVPLAEFLTYYLFYRKRPGKEGHRSYAELAKKTDKSLSDLEDFVDIGAGTTGIKVVVA